MIFYIEVLLIYTLENNIQHFSSNRFNWQSQHTIQQITSQVRLNLYRLHLSLSPVEKNKVRPMRNRKRREYLHAVFMATPQPFLESVRAWRRTSCLPVHLPQFCSSEPLSQSSLPSQCQSSEMHWCSGGPQLCCVSEHVLLAAAGSKKLMWNKLEDEAIKDVFVPSIKVLLR